MPQTIEFDGVQHEFPDDATDDEIKGFFSRGATAASEPHRAAGVGSSLTPARPSALMEGAKAFSRTILPQVSGATRVLGLNELADFLTSATPEASPVETTASSIAKGIGSAGALLAEGLATRSAAVPAVGAGLGAYESTYSDATQTGAIPEEARQRGRESFLKTIPEMAALVLGLGGGMKAGEAVAEKLGGGLIGKFVGRTVGATVGGQVAQSSTAAAEGGSPMPTAESLASNALFGTAGGVAGLISDAAKAVEPKPKGEPNAERNGTQVNDGGKSPPQLEQAPEERVRVRDDAGNRVETQPGEVNGPESAQVTAVEEPGAPEIAPAGKAAAEQPAPPSPIVGPALRNAGEEAPTLKGKVGDEHGPMKIAAAKEGVDVTDAEHGFHDADGNFLNRKEAAQRLLDTGAIEKPKFDEMMKRKEPGATSQDLQDIAKGKSEGPGAAAKTEPLASYEKRRFGERFQEDKTIDPAIREATGNRYYEPIPNIKTVNEAEAIIEQRGTDEGVHLVRDESFPMDHRVRSTMAQGLIKKLNQSHAEAIKAGDTKAAEGFLNQAVDTAEYLSELGTKLGQGVQSFAIWSRLTPEGMLMAVKRQVKKARTKVATESGGEVEKIIKSADESGEGAARKAEEKNAKLIEAEANRIAKILSDTPSFKTSKPNEVLALIRKHLKEPQERFTERLIDYGATEELAASIDRMASENRRRIDLARTVEELGRPEREAVQIAEIMARDLSDTPSLSDKRTSEIRKLVTEHSTKGVDAFAAKMKELGVKDTALIDRLDRISAENRRRVEVIERVRVTERREKEFQRTANRIAQQLSDTPIWAKKGTRDAAQELIREHLKEEQTDFVSRLVKFGADRKTAESIDRMAAENRKRAVAVDRATRAEQLRKQYGKTPVGKKLPKELWQKVVELSDAGLLTDEAFYDLASERLGLPKFDKANIAELTRMAAEIEKTPEGFQRNEKMAEFLGRVADLKGIDSADVPTALWYANILSGYSTQLVNTVDTALNVLSESATMAASHPSAVPDILSGLYQGLVKGGLEAASTLKTGRGRTENKLQVPPVLERTRFGEKGGVPMREDTALGRVMKAAFEKKPAKILNLWKYPLRAMVASDTVFYNSFKEARSRVLARALAKKEGLSGDKLFQRVDELLNHTPEKVTEATAKAESEGLTGSRLKRRIREIQEQGRPEELVSNADEAAAIATYNHDPTGTLGVIASKLGEITQNVPAARVVVPFTRIVANVANRGLDYTPWGYKRLFFGQGGGERFATEAPVGEAYRTQIIKATAGTVGMTALAALDASGTIQVTSSGPQNPEERKQLQNSGWKPYSVKVGNTWLSYQYTPLNLGLAMVGHYRDAVRYNKLDEKDAQTRLAYGALKAGSTLFDMSFLSGLSNFIETVSGATSSTKAAGKMIARTGSSVLIPNLVKQIDRLFDPTLYDAQTVQQMLIRETPVARSTMLQPMLNVLGEPIKLSNNRFFSGNTNDPVWKLIVAKQAFISVPSKTRKVGDRAITPEEYRTLIKDSGKEIRSYIEKNLPALQAMKAQEAQQAIDTEAEKIRRVVIRRFR